jgi:hypothetical protein
MTRMQKNFVTSAPAHARLETHAFNELGHRRARTDRDRRGTAELEILFDDDGTVDDEGVSAGIVAKLGELIVGSGRKCEEHGEKFWTWRVHLPCIEERGASWRTRWRSSGRTTFRSHAVDELEHTIIQWCERAKMISKPKQERR